MCYSVTLYVVHRTKYLAHLLQLHKILRPLCTLIETMCVGLQCSLQAVYAKNQRSSTCPFVYDSVLHTNAHVVPVRFQQ